MGTLESSPIITPLTQKIRWDKDLPATTLGNPYALLESDLALKLLKDGTKQYSAKDFKRAVEIYTQALSHRRINQNIRYNIYVQRSKAYLSLRRWVEALKDADKSVSLCGSEAMGHRLRGEALFYGFRNYPEAINALHMAQTLDRNLIMRDRLEKLTTICEVAQLNELGEASVNHLHYRDAIQFYTSAIAKDYTCHALFLNRSVAYARNKEWDNAIADANRYIDARPSSYEGYFRKGEALLGRREYGEALEIFEKAIEKGAPSALIDTVKRARTAKNAEAYRDPLGSSQSAYGDVKYAIPSNPLPDSHSQLPPLSPTVPLVNTDPGSDKPTLEKRIEESIENIASRVLMDGPLWRLDTQEGTLRGRDEIKTIFKTSSLYHDLVRLLSNLSPEELSKPPVEYTATKVIESFFRYAMFSHKWGEHEPLFEHVRNARDIYHLSPQIGNKLQKFCDTARCNGFAWAWSDTVCIDRKNYTELQTSLPSMFKWYRNSAMTIVYLFDILTLGELKNSVWFTRGWTLQELLAPSVIRFYNRDWRPLSMDGEVNHKKVETIRRAVMEATQIDERSLEEFQPGKVQPRVVLAWASKRETKEMEDAAYSIMALFDRNLPIQYSDKERALGRLLSQVIGLSGGISVLDWAGEPNRFNSCFPASLHGFQHQDCAPELLSTTELTERTGQIMKFLSDNREVKQTLYKLFFLSEHHPPRFAAQELDLPCITYQVTLQHDYQPRDYTSHRLFRFILLTPEALDSLCVTTRQPLSTDLEYRLARVWDPNYLAPHKYCNDDEGQTEEVAVLLSRLAQPFHALLLVRENRGTLWRRIPTVEPILTCTKDVTRGLHKLEIKRLAVQ